MYNLWLDDIRNPGSGWVWVKTVKEAQALILSVGMYNIALMSLDHDLGACKDCMNGLTAQQWLEKTNFTQMPNCNHFGTGYDFVCWMEDNECWPQNKPTVHSANPIGKQRMLSVIDRNYL